MTPISQDKAGQGRKKNKSQSCLTIVEIDPRTLIPSPLNEKVYKPVDQCDLELKNMVESMTLNGVLEPLVVSADYYILSGHRRREAAILAGLEAVPCRVREELHDDPNFLQLLVEHNNQRVKTRPEAMREAVVRTNFDEAYRALIAEREKTAEISTETIKVGNRGRRKIISRVKYEIVNAIKKIVEENRKFWPLSDRQIHYRLLNNPPLRNTKKPESRYINDRKSYQDTCDLLTRLRLTGNIPMGAIADPTRPTTSWAVYGNAQSFAKDQLGNFFKGYRRNLQQSQPLHIEVIAEKMTIEGIIRPVCGKYNLPFSIGRGFSSLPARYEIVKRFRSSGKERILLLILSDHDPEGISIGESLLQSFREDFGEEHAQAIRVGLNLEHITRFGLSDNPAEAKKTSSRYRQFVKRYGKKVYELETLTPLQLQTILSEAIDSVINVELFNTELAAERKDAAYLQVVRERIYDDSLDLLKDCENEQFDAGDIDF